MPKGYDFTPIRMPSALFAVISALLFYLIILRLNGEAFEAFVFSLLLYVTGGYGAGAGHRRLPVVGAAARWLAD